MMVAALADSESVSRAAAIPEVCREWIGAADAVAEVKKRSLRRGANEKGDGAQGAGP